MESVIPPRATTQQTAKNGAGAKHPSAPPIDDHLKPTDLGLLLKVCQCANPRCSCQREGSNVHCPAHDDENPSCSIEASGNNIVAKCYAGCSQDVLFQALKGIKNRRTQTLPAPTHRNGSKPKKRKPARTTYYDYRLDGKLIFQAVRYDYSDGTKDFTQRRPDGKGGWIYNLDGVTTVLYEVDAVRKAHTVIICEGEECANVVNAALKKAGLYGPVVATTAPLGATKWREHYAADLLEKNIIVLPDNDEPGRKHAQMIVDSLIGKVPSLKVVELPGLPEKGDVADWLRSEGDIEQLLKIAQATPETKPKLHFERLLLTETLLRLRLEYLLQYMLLERGTSLVTANYGAYKSFNILAMLLCIALGIPWHGRNVKRGTVVYIIAEGAYTTADRVRAWMIRHNMPAPDNFHIIEQPVQIADPVQCGLLIEDLRDLAPAIVVFDTLAKCNVGRDENAADAMGLFTHAMERISRELDTHVMAVHHNNKAGNARGSNSLPANVDTHIVLEASPGRVVTFKCDKQKGAPFEPFSLVGHIVELPEVDEYGRQVTSLVFEPTDTSGQIPKADETRSKILEVLRNSPDGLRASEWEVAVTKGHKICGKSMFYNHRDVLVSDEKVRKEGSVYHAV